MIGSLAASSCVVLVGCASLYRRGLEYWRSLDGTCHADVLLEVANRR